MKGLFCWPCLLFRPGASKHGQRQVTPGGGYFTINSYGGVRRKDFCYDPIPEIWSDIDTQSQKICQILIPNRRSNKSNSTSKG